MAADNAQLLKVLVVHGYRQSGTTSYAKTGSFRKGLKKIVDLVYITAPNKIPDVEEVKENGETSEEFGWWFSSTSQPVFSSLQPTDIDDGHDESVRLIEDTVKDKGPFDGILGFSQGATLVAHICALQENPERSEELSKLFESPVILNHAGGHFLPATSKEKKIYQTFLEHFQKKN